MTEVSYKRCSGRRLRASKQSQITISWSLLIWSRQDIQTSLFIPDRSLLCILAALHRLTVSPPYEFPQCLPAIHLWALFLPSLFPVISVWRTIYLLRTYSFLQRMNKLRRSLNAKPCCKISMPDKYIRFHPIVVWQNSEKWTFPVRLRSLSHGTQDTR